MSLCLPTYVVIDASSSMKPHETVLNATLSRLHYNLATNPRVSEFARVCVVAFSTDVHVVIPMSDMEQVPSMPEVICGGRRGLRQDLRPAAAVHRTGCQQPADAALQRAASDGLLPAPRRRPDRRELAELLPHTGGPELAAPPARDHLHSFGGAQREVLEQVATKALFIADGSDTESALSGAISGLLNTLIASSNTGQMQIATDVKGLRVRSGRPGIRGLMMDCRSAFHGFPDTARLRQADRAGRGAARLRRRENLRFCGGRSPRPLGERGRRQPAPGDDRAAARRPPQQLRGTVAD